MKWRAMMWVNCHTDPPEVIGECDWTHKTDWLDHLAAWDGTNWKDGTISVGVEYDDGDVP